MAFIIERERTNFVVVLGTTLPLLWVVGGRITQHFLMIIIVSIVGAFNINALKNDTENILTANYNSLEYCRTILDAIENKTGDSWQNLERDLNKQEQNITEIGEAEATEQIRINFEQLKIRALFS